MACSFSGDWLGVTSVSIHQGSIGKPSHPSHLHSSHRAHRHKLQQKEMVSPLAVLELLTIWKILCPRYQLDSQLHFHPLLQLLSVSFQFGQHLLWPSSNLHPVPDHCSMAGNFSTHHLLNKLYRWLENSSSAMPCSLFRPPRAVSRPSLAGSCFLYGHLHSGNQSSFPTLYIHKSYCIWSVFPSFDGNCLQLLSFTVILTSMVDELSYYGFCNPFSRQIQVSISPKNVQVSAGIYLLWVHITSRPLIGT